MMYRGWWLGGLVLLIAASYKRPLFEQGKQPLQGVVYAPAQPFSRRHHPLSAEQCRKCHQSIYRQWKRSRHARSFSNRIFTVAFQHSPYRWCVHCHAPLPEQASQVPTQTPAPHSQKTAHPRGPTTQPTRQKGSQQAHLSLNEGINCAACHIREGHILTAKKPTARTRRYHPNIRQDRRIGTARFCAGCHQFSFIHKLTEPTKPTGVLLQDTYQEWSHSYARKQGKTCQTCHMARGSHAFPGAHNRSFVARALRTQVTMLTPQAVQVQLTSRRVGHTIPTGDPFRRLKLTLCADASCKQVLARKTLRKIFAVRRGQWRPIKDMRVPTPTHSRQGRLSLQFTLPKPHRFVFWRLTYHFVEYPHEAFLPASDVSMLVASGRARYIASQKKD